MSISRPSANPVRIAVDIGGTFTDLQILMEATGEIRAHKTPTTPSDPSVGLMTGIREAAMRFGFRLVDVGFLLHGTTIATNAVLERRLPKGVLLTTSGFEDVLEIGRHARRDVYGLRAEIFPVLIPRDRRFGVRERIRGDGRIETPLDDGAIGAVLDWLDAVGAECVAIVLLNSFLDPSHERRLKGILAAKRPDLPVSLSSEISPEMREYERSSTTVLNALLMPVVRFYLDRLQARLDAEGFAPRLYLVQSNGGVCSLETAAEQPARLLLSGPSGGALAAMRLSHEQDLPNLVAVDMGGTSFDVSVVGNGRITLVTQGEVDRLPVRLPMVEIRTIGNGGGSIASVDHGGRLTVGPRSAGAQPGPVCYGRGGTEPVVTDANVVLGRIDPDYFLGGAMALDAAAARAAIAARVGAPLDLAVEAAAEGILTVTNASLGAATRLSLFEKGLDPRDFALLSFGGAGGLHATDVARELGIRRVVFPREPGTFSAFGILFSDLVQDLAWSRLLRAETGRLPDLAAGIEALARDAHALLDRDGIAPAQRRLMLSADMRYVGQAFEILVPWGDASAPDAAGLAGLIETFHGIHRQRFSYADPEAPVEIVTLRLSAVGQLPKPVPAIPDFAGKSPLKGHRRIFVDGSFRLVPIYDRGGIGADAGIEGPAVVEEGYTTLYVAPGWRLGLGAAGALIAVDMADTEAQGGGVP